MLEYGFMRNALLAVLIITPLFGLMGTMLVNKKMANCKDIHWTNVKNCQIVGYTDFF